MKFIVLCFVAMVVLRFITPIIEILWKFWKPILIGTLFLGMLYGGSEFAEKVNSADHEDYKQAVEQVEEAHDVYQKDVKPALKKKADEIAIWKE